MTKEKFIEVMTFIKDHRDLENEFCGILEKLSPGEYVNAFIYTEYEGQLCSLIKDLMDIDEEDDILEYFMYELNFGDDWDQYKEYNNVDLSSIEKLYDYLVTRKGK